MEVYTKGRLKMGCIMVEEGWHMLMEIYIKVIGKTEKQMGMVYL